MEILSQCYRNVRMRQLVNTHPLSYSRVLIQEGTTCPKGTQKQDMGNINLGKKSKEKSPAGKRSMKNADKKKGGSSMNMDTEQYGVDCKEKESTSMKMKITQYGPASTQVPEDGVIINHESLNEQSKCPDGAGKICHSQQTNADSIPSGTKRPNDMDKENRDQDHLSSQKTRRKVKPGSSGRGSEQLRFERELLNFNVRKRRNLRTERGGKNDMAAVDRLTRPWAIKMMRKHRITQPVKKH